MNFFTKNKDDGERDYKSQVQLYSDENLLAKERSKRRRKTGDVVGTGLSAAAAMATPGMWAVAGANAKSYLDNSTKHKIIKKEMSRRGLSPIEEELSDTLLPILASAGSMAVGRAIGGSAGHGVASQTGNLLQSVSSRAFGGSSGSKKDKSKKGRPYGPQHPTPSAYSVPPNQAPPQTLLLQYHPPTAQYPNGYYSPAPVQPSCVVSPARNYPPSPPLAMNPYPPAQFTPPPSPQNYQSVPPALAYINSPSSPQVFRGPEDPGLRRSQTTYENALSYPQIQRSHTFM